MTTTSTVINIDTIDDQKGLGYPDSRKLARDSHGNLYLAYRKKTEQGGKVCYHIFVACSSNNGRTWKSNAIEETGAYTQRMPSLAIDSQGRIHVVWYGLDLLNQNQHQIKYAQSLDQGQNWSHWQNLAYVPGYTGQQQWQQHPTIFVDQKDRIHVAWDGLDVDHPLAPQAKFIRSNNGGKTWSNWANVHPSPKVNRSRPTVIVAGSAIYLLAYGYVENVQQVVWSKSHDRGNYWTAWAPIAPSNRDQRHISAAIDSQDRLHVVWRQQPSNRDSAVQAHYALYDGKAWQAPQIISPSLTRYQFFPSITLCHNAENGDIPYIIWSEIDDASDYPKDAPTAGTVYYAHTIAQSEWCDPIRLRNSLNDIYPSFARNVDSEQSILDFVWLENLGTEQKIFYDQVLLQPESEPVIDVAETTPDTSVDITAEITADIAADDLPVPSEQPDEAVQAEVEPVQLEVLETQPEIQAASAEPIHIPEATIDEVVSSQNDAPSVDPTEFDSVAVDTDSPIEIDIPQADIYKTDLSEADDTEPPLLDISDADAAQVDMPDVDIHETDLPKIDMAQVDIEPPLPDTGEISSDQVDMPEADIDEEELSLAQMTHSETNEVEVSQIDEVEPEEPAGAETTLAALEQRQIVREETGLCYAAYAIEFQVRKQPYEQIFIAKSDDDGASWVESQKPAIQVGPYHQSTPAIAIDSKSNLHTVWAGCDPLNRQITQIKYSRSDDQGESWSPWRNIARVKTLAESDDRNQQAPVIACGPEDTLYVAWQGTDEEHSEHSQIKLTHSVDQGKTWSTWKNINPEPCSFSQPNLLVTSDNVAHIVALCHAEYSSQFAWIQSDDQGQNWSSWEPLDATPHKQSDLSLAVDDQGRLYAEWREPDEGQSDHYAAFYDQHGWQTPQLLLPEAEDVLDMLSDDGDIVLDSDSSGSMSDISEPEDEPKEVQLDSSDIMLDSELPDILELDTAASEQITSGDLEDIFEVAAEFFSDDTADDSPADDTADSADDEWTTEAISAVWAEPATPESVAEFEVEPEPTAASSDIQDAPSISVATDAMPEIVEAEAIEVETIETEQAAATNNIAEVATVSDDLQDEADAQPVTLDYTADGGPQSDTEVEVTAEIAPEVIPEIIAEESVTDSSTDVATEAQSGHTDVDVVTKTAPEITPEIIAEESVTDLPTDVATDVEIADSMIAEESSVAVEEVLPAISPSTWPEVQSPTENEIERSILTATYQDQGPAFQLDRRVSFWARYFDFHISPLQERSDTSSGTTLYVVKHIFTTRNGEWEPSDQPGSIPQWASATYENPWMGQDMQTDPSHYLFGAVIGPKGDFMSQEVLQLEGPAQNGARRSNHFGQSGWHYLPLTVDNRYRPSAIKLSLDQDERWGWSPATSQIAEAVVGNTLPDDYQISIYVVWQAIPNKRIEPSPFMPLYTTPSEHHAIQ